MNNIKIERYEIDYAVYYFDDDNAPCIIPSVTVYKPGGVSNFEQVYVAWDETKKFLTPEQAEIFSNTLIKAIAEAKKLNEVKS
jgi:hypothetical protein